VNVTTAIRIEVPASEDRLRALRAGDEVLLCGRVVTARDRAHRHLVERPDERARALLAGRFVYHCGPVIAPDAERGGWRVVAAGPTASMAEEPWEAEVLERYGVRGIIGRGGMGPRTLAALAEHGAVYLDPARALAVSLARRVTRVHGVYLLDELGPTEALWDVEVVDFPAVVTMDAHGAVCSIDAALLRPSPRAAGGGTEGGPARA
jgi:fumarate hydratase class I